ncbi:MAG: pilus assembly protein N-terminal domain-containing protein [Pirellulales bacterium]
MATKLRGRRIALSIGLSLATAVFGLWAAPSASAQSLQFGGSAPIVHKVRATTERMEMTANTSKLLTLDQVIPRAQVNNRDILELTALSPTEVQVFAKKPGVTQINLWGKDDKVHTIDVMVFGDARELEMIIKTEFPNAAIRVRPIAQSVVLSGFVDRQDHVSQIIRIAEDYYPKVVSHITVGGVQQISLNVKVYEVSRTRLRTLGMEWSTTQGAEFVVSSISGLIGAASIAGASGVVAGGSADGAVAFGVVGDDTSFFGFIEALRRNDLIKVLAEPTLVTVSGRPAFFNSGGEFPILVPQSLGTSSIEYKKFGTQVDFVPVVLGNGNIRLEVRPKVSELDDSRGISINGVTVPALKERVVDTAVEMKPGQTLALAGLVQTKLESSNKGLPWISDLPYIGVPFRRVREDMNEIELLILVTPQVIEAVDCSELPPCMPGMESQPARDWDFYMKGYLEVPSSGPCGPGMPCGPGGSATMVPSNGMIYQEFGPEAIPPGATIQEVPSGIPALGPGGASRSSNMGRQATRRPQVGPSISKLSAATNAPHRGAAAAAGPALPNSRSTAKAAPKQSKSSNAWSWFGKKPTPAKPATTASSSRVQNVTSSRQNPSIPHDARTSGPPMRSARVPGFIGPVGYDVTYR